MRVEKFNQRTYHVYDSFRSWFYNCTSNWSEQIALEHHSQFPDHPAKPLREIATPKKEKWNWANNCCFFIRRRQFEINLARTPCTHQSQQDNRHLINIGPTPLITRRRPCREGACAPRDYKLTPGVFCSALSSLVGRDAKETRCFRGRVGGGFCCWSARGW